MQLSINKKNVLYFCGVVVLGAFGSGLWDLAVKPLLAISIEYIVEIILNTFKGVQNSIYSEIASLDREITGRMLISFCTGGIIGFSAIPLIIGIKNKTNDKKWSFSPTKTHAILYMVFIFTFITFSLLRTVYIIEKQNNYLQLKRIISPYITKNERLMISSEFSLISSIDDHSELISKMEAIAKNQGIQPPKKH